MKTLKNNLVIIVLASLVFSSCKNDLKLNAPYKEYPSIYAILNPDEAIQTIRVNKVFLGEGDANQMAKVADSVNYKPGEITLTLKHSVNPAIITFSETTTVAQDGAFSTFQRLYVSDQKIETSGIYTLTVKNNNTGNIFTATTTAISKIDKNGQISSLFDAPFYPFDPITPPTSPPYIDYSGLKQKYNVRFAPNEGEVYKITIRFHFYDSLYNNSTIKRFVDFTGGNIEKKTKTEIRTDFTGDEVYKALGIGLSKLGLSKDIYGRKMERVEYIINSSTQEYMDYLQFAAPSLSINQTKPLYSNFKDGAAIGIFTFRTTFTMSKNLSAPYTVSFADNSNTCYKFFRSNLSAGCFK